MALGKRKHSKCTCISRLCNPTCWGAVSLPDRTCTPMSLHLTPGCWAPCSLSYRNATLPGGVTYFTLMVKCQVYVLRAPCACPPGSLPQTFTASSSEVAAPAPPSPPPNHPAVPYAPDDTIPTDFGTPPETDALHAALLGDLIGGIAFFFLVIIPTAAYFLNRRLTDMDKVHCRTERQNGASARGRGGHSFQGVSMCRCMSRGLHQRVTKHLS